MVIYLREPVFDLSVRFRERSGEMLTGNPDQLTYKKAKCNERKYQNYDSGIYLLAQ
jgi:hypothetical protein